MSKFNIGILDDEKPNIRRIKRQGRDQSFNFVEVSLKNDVEEMAEEIISQKLNGILVDYQLKITRPEITYTGVDLVIKLDEYVENYPSFILTAFSDTAENELIDVNKIYEKEAYFNDPSLLNRRIQRQVENYRKAIDKSEEEVLRLRKKDNLTLKEEERLVELDTFIEKHLSKKDSLAKSIKSSSYNKKLDSLLEKTERLLGEIEKL
ncbi:hypothetical protein [Shouchella hunanensis]|uniref:Response regulator receiver domain-containing protein n=1 Tax=Shouchella hunanensis TaxID=766894 RepID=A0ABY7WA00_9BACI|nr:hypothetical protein [Shouchella hunanensis]WDF05496.1 hypothetical protein PQ477_08655 [Shouchella hunanensis]